MNTSPGAPRKLSPKQEEKLIDIITKDVYKRQTLSFQRKYSLKLIREK